MNPVQVPSLVPHLSVQSLQSVVSALQASVVGGAFWTAVTLPLAYPAALLVEGWSLPLFGALIVLHGIALLLGHGYSPGGG
ncbi:MAG: hypothetical protein ABEI31_03235 [Halodesulfurarchaeum sp.]